MRRGGADQRPSGSFASEVSGRISVSGPGRRMKRWLLPPLLVVLGVPTPAHAHPFTGGPSSPGQIAISAAGALAALGGVVVMVRSTTRPDTPGKARRAGLILAGVGFATFLVGPDLLRSPPPECVRLERPATVEIVAPRQGESVAAGRVALHIDLKGGRATSLSSTRNRPGEGHLHILLDGRLISMSGTLEEQLTIPAGRHEIEVEYAANNNAPFCTPVGDVVAFEVAG